MVKNYLGAIVVAIFLIPHTIFAQSKEEYYFQAEDFIEDGNYYKALEIFQLLLNESPNNANLNFKVGFCYLNTATDKAKSIPYFEFASNHINENYNTSNFSEEGAPLEVFYYLGKAYHVNYRIDDAERVFFKLKSEVSAEDQAFLARINHELLSCQVARVLMKSPVEMKVSNLGRNVNSTYSEHSPVISGDESLLIFTSKREANTGGLKMDDGQFFEDIYLCSFDGTIYSPARKISTNINTIGHEASIGLSFDGTKLFIYKDDNGDGNIYVSNRKGSQWDLPEKLPDVINSKFRETHASMSFDQNQIFFTSDRKGGFGGLDIYRVRKLPNGKWSKAMNLGPEINTPYDEDGPYFHPDGTSLFFASQGHNTMGGFDIFVSYIDENDNWTTPQNLGFPINTPDDDIYYMPSVDGRRAYYASYANNSLGNYDIFRIDLSESHVRNQTVIAGFARSETGELLKEAIITLNDTDDQLVGIYTPDPETGKFLFILPRGKKFNAIFESSNFASMEFFIDVPEYAYDQSQQVVAFNDIMIPVTKEPVLLTDKELVETTKPSGNNSDDNSAMVNEANDQEKTETIIEEEKAIQTKKAKSAELLVASELNDFRESNQSTIENRDSGDKEELFDPEESGNTKIESKAKVSQSSDPINTEETKNSKKFRYWIWVLVLPVVLYYIYREFHKK